jgi:hypothetical protein
MVAMAMSNVSMSFGHPTTILQKMMDVWNFGFCDFFRLSVFWIFGLCDFWGF